MEWEGISVGMSVERHVAVCPINSDINDEGRHPESVNVATYPEFAKRHERLVLCSQTTYRTEHILQRALIDVTTSRQHSKC